MAVFLFKFDSVNRERNEQKKRKISIWGIKGIEAVIGIGARRLRPRDKLMVVV